MTQISFKGIYYIPSHLKQEECNDKTANLFKNDVVNEIKNIVENSNFFNKLSEDTDVFVSSSIDKTISRDPNRKFIGALAASFKDPYETIKKRFATLNFVVMADSKDSVLSKLKNSVENLCNYKEIKDVFYDDKVVFLGDDGVITYEDC